MVYVCTFLAHLCCQKERSMPLIPNIVLSRGWLNVMRFITGSDSSSVGLLVRTILELTIHNV